MEQQLKQQLMQKKNLCKSLAKKKESTVFSILPFAKIVLPTIKKNTIHHHIKKSHTHFKMISNHQELLKLFMTKREKFMRKINNKNKTLTKSHQFI
jgi:uncharacterized ubiquitin-like protein YukD